MNPELLILIVCADVLFIAQQEQEYLLELDQKEKQRNQADKEDNNKEQEKQG